MLKVIRLIAGIVVGMMIPLTGCGGSAAESTPQQMHLALEKNLTVSGTIETKEITKNESMSRLSFYLTTVDVSFDNQSTFDIELGKKMAFYEMNADASLIFGSVVEWGLEPIEYKQRLNRTDLRTRYLLPDHEMRYTDDSSGAVVRKMSAGSSKGSFLAALSLMNRRDEQKEDQIPVCVAKKERCVLKMNITQTSWSNDSATDRIQMALPELHIRIKGGTRSFLPLAYFREAKGERPNDGGRLWKLDNIDFIHLEKDKVTKLIESRDSGLATRILALNWLAERDPDNAGPILVKTAGLGKSKRLLPVCFELMSVLKNPDLARRAEETFKAQTKPLGLRLSALDYLMTIGRTPDLKPLVDTAIHQGPEPRRVVIVTLGRMGLPQARDALLSLLEIDSIRSSHNQIRANLKK